MEDLQYIQEIKKIICPSQKINKKSHRICKEMHIGCKSKSFRTRKKMLIVYSQFFKIKSHI